MNTKVKICGIQTKENAKVAIQYGADFIGFNFVPTSKRLITLSVGQEIIQNVNRSEIKIVGVFQNQPLSDVLSISHELQLDYIQLHGEESPEYCDQISTKIIKVFALEPEFDPQQLLISMSSYHVSYFLLDRKKQGEGEMLNPELLKKISDQYKLFIAGGLNSENIRRSVKISKPFAVDVSSGVETNGRIDTHKVKEFIQKVKFINY